MIAAVMILMGVMALMSTACVAIGFLELQYGGSDIGIAVTTIVLGGLATLLYGGGFAILLVGVLT